MSGYRTCDPCRVIEQQRRPEKEQRYRLAGKRAASNARNNPRNNFSRMMRAIRRYPLHRRKYHGIDMFNRAVGRKLVDPASGAMLA